jgi:hypothetical protein
MLSACLGAVYSVQAQQVVRLTQPVDENARVTLRGTVYPLANASNDRGAASPGYGTVTVSYNSEAESPTPGWQVANGVPS